MSEIKERLKALGYLGDFEGGIQGGTILKFPKGIKCPFCKDKFMTPYALIISKFPYIHGDLACRCLRCGKMVQFGVPEDKNSGLSLIIWDTNPKRALKEALKAKPPICPFHNTPMILTKIFGDKVGYLTYKEMKIQFKCPTCFLTAHGTIDEYR